MSDQLTLEMAAPTPEPPPWRRFGPEYVQPPAARTNDPETSHEAARAYLDDAEAQNAMIVAVLVGAGRGGLCYPEIDDLLGWPHPTAARRIAALRRPGQLRDVPLVYSYDGKDGRPLIRRVIAGHRPCAVHVAAKYAGQWTVADEAALPRIAA